MATQSRKGRKKVKPRSYPERERALSVTLPSAKQEAARSELLKYLNRPHFNLAFEGDELNGRLEHTRFQYIYNNSYPGSMVAKQDYHKTIVAANKALSQIDRAVRETILYLPPLQGIVLLHPSENFNPMRAFGPLQEEALPEVFRAVRELSAKLESLPGEILSLYEMFWPFAQAVEEKTVQAVQGHEALVAGRGVTRG